MRSLGVPYNIVMSGSELNGVFNTRSQNHTGGIILTGDSDRDQLMIRLGYRSL